MARAKKDPSPEARIEELRQERVRVAGARNTIEDEMSRAQAIVDEFPDCHQAALVDEARGRGQAVSEVAAEASRARATVADRKARSEALRSAEREIQGEIEEIESTDAGIAFLEAQAAEQSAKAELSRTAAEDACAALRTDWTAAESGWGRVSRAYRRRGQPERAPAPVPHPDFPEPVGGGLGHRHPWPGGVRPEDRAARRTSLSVPEVRESLIEVI